MKKALIPIAVILLLVLTSTTACAANAQQSGLPGLLTSQLGEEAAKAVIEALHKLPQPEDQYALAFAQAGDKGYLCVVTAEQAPVTVTVEGALHLLDASGATIEEMPITGNTYEVSATQPIILRELTADEVQTTSVVVPDLRVIAQTGGQAFPVTDPTPLHEYFQNENG